MWTGDFWMLLRCDSLCLRVSANEFGCVGRFFFFFFFSLMCPGGAAEVWGGHGRALSKTKVYAEKHTS